MSDQEMNPLACPECGKLSMQRLAAEAGDGPDWDECSNCGWWTTKDHRATIASLEGRLETTDKSEDVVWLREGFLRRGAEIEELERTNTTLKESNRLALEQLQVMAGQLVTVKEAAEKFRLAAWHDCETGRHEHDCGCMGDSVEEDELLQALSTPPSQAEIRWKAMGDVAKEADSFAHSYLAIHGPITYSSTKPPFVKLVDALEKLAALDHPAAKGETI